MRRPLILVLCSIFLCAATACTNSSVNPIDEVMPTPTTGFFSEETISNVFTTDKGIYYVTYNGDLYKYEEQTDLLIYECGEHILSWSSKYHSFFYIESYGLYMYDLQSGENKLVLALEAPVESHLRNYVICVVGPFVLYRFGQDNYQLDFETGTIVQIPDQLHNIIASNLMTVAYYSDDYQSIFLWDCMGLESKVLLSEESNLPVVTGCFVNDTLIFVRSDGIPRITDFSINGTYYDRLSNYCNSSGMEVIAIDFLFENFICVVTDMDTLERHISVMRIGDTCETLHKSTSQEYGLIGSCRLSADVGSFAYVLTTDTEITVGDCG